MATKILNVNIKNVHEHASKPIKATSNSAACDIIIPERTLIREGRQIIKCGFCTEFHEGYEMEIMSRSGVASKGMPGFTLGKKYVEQTIAMFQLNEQKNSIVKLDFKLSFFDILLGRAQNKIIKLVAETLDSMLVIAKKTGELDKTFNKLAEDHEMIDWEDEQRFDCDVLTGKVDSDYRGEIGIIVNNHDRAFWLEGGTRIAQMTMRKVEEPRFKVVQELSESERGECGFGSTGNK